MSKKQGRSRSLVRESDVADIWSNWSDVLQNTSVCSLIDKYIYMYVYAPIHSFEPIGCAGFSSQDAWPVFELCVSTCSWLGSLASQKVSRLERPKRMIYDYDGFHVLSMFTAKGSLNNTVLWFLEPGILLPLLFFFDIHSFKASSEIGCYNLTWSCSFASPNDRQV